MLTSATSYSHIERLNLQKMLLYNLWGFFCLFVSDELHLVLPPHADCIHYQTLVFAENNCRLHLHLLSLQHLSSRSWTFFSSHLTSFPVFLEACGKAFLPLCPTPQPTNSWHLICNSYKFLRPKLHFHSQYIFFLQAAMRCSVQQEHISSF